MIVFIIGGLLLVGRLLVGLVVIEGPESNLLTPGWFQEMLGRLQFTERRLLPSWWLSSGLLEAGRDSWSESLMFLALMFSNALFFRQLALFTAVRIYRKAYSSPTAYRENPPGATGIGRPDDVDGNAVFPPLRCGC